MYTLRPATDDDFAFVFELQRRTMRAYIEQMFGPWDDDWQHRYFTRHWDPCDARIVAIDGRRVGRVEVREHDDHVYLANINIAPEHQGYGVGARIILDVVIDAAPLPVTLRVLRSNLDAKRLYERLGFVHTHDSDTHHYCRHEPVTIDAAAALTGPQSVIQR